MTEHKRVEFIESYLKIGNDYQWNDNHGELIRCKDCKHRMHDKTCIKNMKRKPDDGFCDEGEHKQY